MLNDKELATVATKLQVPLIISDIMAGEGELTDDVHYGLHSVISDMQPDTALICIAMAASKIASPHYQASPGIRILKLQCESIINSYASLWLQNAQDANVDESEAFEVLSGVSQDLENLAGLLDLAEGFLKARDKNAATLIRILSVQANAQALIAEAIFGSLYQANDVVNDDIEEDGLSAAFIDHYQADNVIQFPVKSH